MVRIKCRVGMRSKTMYRVEKRSNPINPNETMEKCLIWQEGNTRNIKSFCNEIKLLNMTKL